MHYSMVSYLLFDVILFFPSANNGTLSHLGELQLPFNDIASFAILIIVIIYILSMCCEGRRQRRIESRGVVFDSSISLSPLIYNQEPESPNPPVYEVLYLSETDLPSYESVVVDVNVASAEGLTNADGSHQTTYF